MDRQWSWDEPTCGVSRRSDYFEMSRQDDEQKGYIVGGRDAFDGEFPWQVIYLFLKKCNSMC